jgi:hypothetical protein
MSAIQTPANSTPRKRSLATYRNAFWRDGKGSGPEFFQTSAPAHVHRGFIVYQRAEGWDIVLAGVCIAQRVSFAGALGQIDKIVDGVPDSGDGLMNEVRQRAEAAALAGAMGGRP